MAKARCARSKGFGGLPPGQADTGQRAEDEALVVIARVQPQGAPQLRFCLVEVTPVKIGLAGNERREHAVGIEGGAALHGGVTEVRIAGHQQGNAKKPDRVSVVAGETDAAVRVSLASLGVVGAKCRPAHGDAMMHRLAGTGEVGDVLPARGRWPARKARWPPQLSSMLELRSRNCARR